MTDSSASTELSPAPPATAAFDARRAWMGLVLASSMSFVVGLGITAMNLCFEAVQRSYGGTSRSTLSWGITGYAISTASLMVLSGRLADHMGRQRVFRAGTMVFIVGSVVLATSPWAWLFIAGRVIQGVGAAMLGPASLILALGLFPESRRPRTVAAWTALSNMGSAFGPVLSAVVTDRWSWRWVFVAPLLICVVAFLLAPHVLPADVPGGAADSRLDVIGAALGTGVVGVIAFYVLEGPHRGWLTATAVLPVLVAVPAAVWFVHRTRSQPQPLVDPHLFARRRFRSASLACVFLSAAGLSQWLIHPLFLQHRWGYSLLDAGLAITPLPVGSALTGLLAGRLVERVGVRPVVLLGAVVPLAGAALMLASIGDDAHYWTDFLPGALLFSFGFGLVFSPLTVAALHDVDSADLGQASALFSAVRQLSGGLGVAVVVAVLGNAVELPLASIRLAYVAVAVMSALGALVITSYYPRRSPAAVLAPPGFVAAD